MAMLALGARMVRSTDPRLLWKFGYNFGFKGMLSVQRFKKRLKRGQVFPPFLYVSIINSCNLRCTGCWVDVAAPQHKISFEEMDRLIGSAKEHGNSFFGILGGEPFMHPDLIRILEAHPDCYFQIFTNGHFIDDEMARELRRVGNATPLISVEGNEVVSDERRDRLGLVGEQQVLARGREPQPGRDGRDDESGQQREASPGQARSAHSPRIVARGSRPTAPASPASSQPSFRTPTTSRTAAAAA